MPVINGIKMACDACIRGHRSTKCDHGDSRVLMKVRKPGRPLTACPHLPSQQCDCPKTKGCGCSSSITVAFPKKQGCGDCKIGENTVVKTEGKPAGPAIPDVPAAMAGTFKVVKKSAHLAAQIPRARPQSYDGKFFEGIDLNSVNIIPNGQTTTLASPNGDTMNGMAPPQMPVRLAQALPHTYPPNMPQAPFYGGGMANAPTQTPMTSISNGCGMPISSADGEISGFSLSNDSYMNGNIDFMSSGAYMPNGKAQQPILTAPYPLQSTQSYSASSNGTTPVTAVKSCCSSKTSLNSSPNDFGAKSFAQAPIQQSFSTTAYSSSNSPIYTAHVHSNYAYAENFAAPNHQMQKGDWSRNFHMNYSQQPLQPFQQLPMSNDVFQLPPSTLVGIPEICACGSDCECFGCQTHPRNATTLAYILNLSNQMSRQRHNRESASPITPAQLQDPFYNLENQAQAQMLQTNSLGGYYSSGFDKDPMVTSTALKSETPDSLSRTDSPQLSLNGSPFDSMVESQQQELDPSNYFMVDYQLLGSCEGDGAGCQCGDDCQCFGCTIHKPQQDMRLRDEEMGVKIDDGTKTPEEPVVKKSCCG